MQFTGILQWEVFLLGYESVFFHFTAHSLSFLKYIRAKLFTDIVLWAKWVLNSTTADSSY